MPPRKNYVRLGGSANVEPIDHVVTSASVAENIKSGASALGSVAVSAASSAAASAKAKADALKTEYEENFLWSLPGKSKTEDEKPSGVKVFWTFAVSILLLSLWSLLMLMGRFAFSFPDPYAGITAIGVTVGTYLPVFSSSATYMTAIGLGMLVNSYSNEDFYVLPAVSLLFLGIGAISMGLEMDTLVRYGFATPDGAMFNGTTHPYRVIASRPSPEKRAASQSLVSAHFTFMLVAMLVSGIMFFFVSATQLIVCCKSRSARQRVYDDDVVPNACCTCADYAMCRLWPAGRVVEQALQTVRTISAWFVIVTAFTETIVDFEERHLGKTSWSVGASPQFNLCLVAGVYVWFLYPIVSADRGAWHGRPVTTILITVGAFVAMVQTVLFTALSAQNIKNLAVVGHEQCSFPGAECHALLYTRNTTEFGVSYTFSGSETATFAAATERRRGIEMAYFIAGTVMCLFALFDVAYRWTRALTCWRSCKKVVVPPVAVPKSSGLF